MLFHTQVLVNLTDHLNHAKGKKKKCTYVWLNCGHDARNTAHPHFPFPICFYVWGLSMLIYFRVLWRHMHDYDKPCKVIYWKAIFDDILNVVRTTKAKYVTTQFDFHVFCVENGGSSLIRDLNLIPVFFFFFLFISLYVSLGFYAMTTGLCSSHKWTLCTS